MIRRWALLAAVLAMAGMAGPAYSWWGNGHGILSRAAEMSLPEEVPVFFRSGRKMIGHMSYDPDIAKNRGTPLINAAEHSEHYLDVELLKGSELPEGRYDYIRLCTRLGVDAEHVGFVPYALSEWTERLAVAFAEHRKWPDNLFVQQKCLVYAGFLAHYAQDLCQPLHVTIHFNGKKKADGSKEYRGIHERVDSLPEVLEMTPEELAEGQTIAAPEKLMPAILGQLRESFGLMEAVYGLGSDLMKMRDEGPSAGVEAFARERTRESVRFTASLMLYAWQTSADLKFEGWLDRAVADR